MRSKSGWIFLNACEFIGSEDDWYWIMKPLVANELTLANSSTKNIGRKKTGTFIRLLK